jgi:Spy/CpxP family protein refolding chaperone
MISKISLTLFGAAMAGALLYGQTSGTTSPTRTPPTPATMAQMRVNRLAAELSLTDAQKTTALSIFTTAYSSAQTVQTNLRTAQTSLRDAINTNNTAQIDTLATTIGTATGQVTAINAKADAAFYAILTADQKAIHDARPGGGRGPGGPGGMGGMGGGMMRGRRGQ